MKPFQIDWNQGTYLDVLLIQGQAIGPGPLKELEKAYQSIVLLLEDFRSDSLKIHFCLCSIDGSFLAQLTKMLSSMNHRNSIMKKEISISWSFCDHCNQLQEILEKFFADYSLLRFNFTRASECQTVNQLHIF